MKKFSSRFFPKIFAINASLPALMAFGVLFTANCSRSVFETPVHSQQRASFTNITEAIPSPGLEGRADGTRVPFNKAGDLRESFLTQPLPDVWLVFPKDRSETSNEDKGEVVTLPEQVRPLINAYWEVALEYRFDVDVKKTVSGQEYRNRTTALINSMESTRNQLQKLDIQTPTETRPISMNEAFDILKFLGEATIQLGQEAETP